MGKHNPAFLQIGGAFHGRYEVVRALGAGGMGAVYEVIDLTTNRRRALKVMLPTVVTDEEHRLRFEREATVASAIDSDHICETLHAGVDDESGAPFIVLELLKGDKLSDTMKQRGGLPPTEVVTYLTQAAYALDKAHAAGVVHRDLKPDNFIVTYRDDGSPRLKILDFGIAKVLRQTMSGPQTRGILGTPLYMAPEQMHGEIEISAASDLFSLGQMAYSLLTGEPYWKKEEDEADGVYPLLLKIAKGIVEAPSERALERRGVALPEAFDDWFFQATAQDPADRFPTALTLVEALAASLGLEPGHVSPPARDLGRVSAVATPDDDDDDRPAASVTAILAVGEPLAPAAGEPESSPGDRTAAGLSHNLPAIPLHPRPAEAGSTWKKVAAGVAAAAAVTAVGVFSYLGGASQDTPAAQPTPPASAGATAELPAPPEPTASAAAVASSPPASTAASASATASTTASTTASAPPPEAPPAATPPTLPPPPRVKPTAAPTATSSGKWSPPLPGR